MKFLASISVLNGSGPKDKVGGKEKVFFAIFEISRKEKPTFWDKWCEKLSARLLNHDMDSCKMIFKLLPA